MECRTTNLEPEVQARLCYELGYAAYQREEYDQASSLFRQLVFGAPFEKDYWKGFAAAEQMKKEHLSALHAWCMVALLNDRDPTPHFHAAECYVCLGELEDARKALAVAEPLCSGEFAALAFPVKMLNERIEKW